MMVIRYNDCFGRDTIIDVGVFVDKKINCMLRKERQIAAESWDLETAIALRDALSIAIEEVEKKQ